MGGTPRLAMLLSRLNRWCTLESGMHAHAKRIYTIAPENVVLTFADGESYEFEISSAEFFQEDFQAEATRPDDPDAAYRIAGDEDGVVVGRQGPGESGWSAVGEVADVEPA